MQHYIPQGQPFRSPAGVGVVVGTMTVREGRAYVTTEQVVDRADGQYTLIAVDTGKEKHNASDSMATVS